MWTEWELIEIMKTKFYWDNTEFYEGTGENLRKLTPVEVEAKGIKYVGPLGP